MTIAIVGTGIQGASCARSLARRGHEVTVFDRYAPGHAFGSSHGRSRIIRKAYPDSFYTKIMAEGFALWDDLQAHCPVPFVHHTGILYFGREDGTEVHNVRDSLVENGVDAQYVAPGEESGVRIEPGECGYLSNDGGWVHAELALHETLRQAMAWGARISVAEVGSGLESLGGFDRIVLAAGAWLGDFLGQDLEIRLQTVAYVRLNWQGPVWIEDGPNLLYGFPTAPGESTVKIGVHRRGKHWDRRLARPEADKESVELIRAFVRRRFDVSNPIVEEVATCLYTMTPDEDFLWGWKDARTLYLSACSGHGFKFAPWLGERAADILEEKMDISDFPRFSKPLDQRT